jgi:hypothetical protein
MKKQLLLSIVLMLLDGFVNAQILEVNPAFPTVNDVVTITYDATQGNAALVGQNQIYAHAGLITAASTSPTNWQFVQGNWGTVDPEVAMTNIGNNKHTITIDIDFMDFLRVQMCSSLHLFLEMPLVQLWAARQTVVISITISIL